MSDINDLTKMLLQFRDDRDWNQFHNAKDLAIAVSVEANELLELFLWKSPDDVNPDKIKEELADVISFALLMAEKYGFDVKNIVLDKIALNGIKYPIEKAKGRATKYDEL